VKKTFDKVKSIQYYNKTMYYIQKLVKNREQYSVTLPKDLVKKMNLGKARVVQIWGTEEKIIHIEEYNGKEKRKARITGHRPKTD